MKKEIGLMILIFLIKVNFYAQTNISLDNYENMGNSVIIKDNYAFIGDPRLIADEASSAVIIFQKKGSRWEQYKIIQENKFGKTFGKCITHSNKTLFISDDERSEVLLYHKSDKYNKVFAVLTPEYPKKERNFGRAIAATDEYLFVSYVQKAQGIIGAKGCIDVYHHKDRLWFKVDEIRSPDNFDVEGFGSVIDVDKNQLVVSSNKGILNNKKGSVYIYALESNDWKYKQQIIVDTPKKMNGFGYALKLKNNQLFVSKSELKEFDRKNDMYAFQRENFFLGGSVYCYSNRSVNSIEYSLDTIIKAPIKSKLDGFGSAISVSEDKLFISSYQNFKQEGKVYYYNLGCNNIWTLKSIIKSQNPQEEKQYGFSTYATSEEVLVSAKRASFGSNIVENNTENFGKAYFYSYMKEEHFMGQLEETRKLQYKSPSGKMYYKSEDFIDTIVKKDGCDSLIHIKLTILNTDAFVLDQKGDVSKLFKLTPTLESNKEVKNTNFVKRIEVEKPFIKLEYFDQGTMDNDTISIRFNDTWLVLNEELTKEKKHIVVRLEEGENSIVFRAENDGAEYPNTCRVIIYNQDDELIDYASMKSNMGDSSYIIINLRGKND